MSSFLWNIDRTIEQLTETIAEMRANGEDCAEAETALKQYVEQELPKKVTGICHWLRKCRQDRETAQAEAKRYKALADAIEADEKRLKDICISVMQSRGIEKLNGCPGNALRVQGNGGKQSLEIYNEFLIPDEFLVALVRVRKTEWLDYLETGSSIAHSEFSYQADHDAIRAELSNLCEECFDGTQAVADPNCEACGGTGFHLVPGARLLPRGYQLRVVDR